MLVDSHFNIGPAAALAATVLTSLGMSKWYWLTKNLGAQPTLEDFLVDLAAGTGDREGTHGDLEGGRLEHT